MTDRIIENAEITKAFLTEEALDTLKGIVQNADMQEELLSRFLLVPVFTDPYMYPNSKGDSLISRAGRPHYGHTSADLDTYMGKLTREKLDIDNAVYCYMSTATLLAFAKQKFGDVMERREKLADTLYSATFDELSPKRQRGITLLIEAEDEETN